MNYEELLSKESGQHSKYFSNARVIELFSVQRADPPVRSFFKDCVYVGLDTVVGSGVDVVASVLGDVDLNALAPFDIVVSCGRLHDEAWWGRSLEVCNRLRPGGLVVLEWEKSKDGPTEVQVIETLKSYDVISVSDSSEDDEQEDENWIVVARKKEKPVMKVESKKKVIGEDK